MTNLDDVFSTEPKPLTIYERPHSGVSLTDDTELAKQSSEDRRKNYVVVKENLEELVESVRNVVLDSAIEVRSNPSARMLETFSILAKTYAELNDQLLNLPNNVSSLEKENSHQSNNVNTAVFVGTSEGIIDLIKGQRIK